MTPGLTRDTLIAAAHAQGFDAVRITRPDAIPHVAGRLKTWLDLGYHGSMDWMAERVAQRADPLALWPEVKSIIMLGMNYGPQTDPLATLALKDRGSISVYARHRDYHDVVKGALKRLAQTLVSQGGGALKVFVDTAPVSERALAEAAGLGWQGKHTVLVSRDLGNWLFLGAIYTTLDLAPDSPESDHCGSCTRCLVACPTYAFPEPYLLDARRCISYLTIEHKGPIPRDLRPLMGNRIYGCDDCLAVCPWNKYAETARELKFHARADLIAPSLADLAALDDAAFRALFSGSPVKRIGRDRFIRNVLIAMGNSGDSSFSDRIFALLDDPAPIVRGAAVWAWGQLVSADEFTTEAGLRTRSEADGDVLTEWHARKRDDNCASGI